MKEFICKKDFYIEDVKFAAAGDYVVLLQDNTTVVNVKDGQRVTQSPWIVSNTDYFAQTYTSPKVVVTEEPEKVNHPSHYTWLKDCCGVEVIDITRHMDFCLGNALKYILRAGHKTEEGYTNNKKEIEDLEKAIWYIKDRIKQLKH